jgi:hypothetical protein
MIFQPLADETDYTLRQEEVFQFKFTSFFPKKEGTPIFGEMPSSLYFYTICKFLVIRSISSIG